MKSDQYYIDKLYRMPQEFLELYRKKEYGRASYLYRKASIIALFLELPQKQISELFGNWEDDGDPDQEAPQGMFPRDLVMDSDWRCCIKRHQTYQDEACRRVGAPVRYYSDEDYCSLYCQKIRHALRT